MNVKKSNLFEDARIQLVLDHPFFAVLALHMLEREMDMGHPIIQQLVTPTCGVDGRHLWVNPDFVKKLNADEKVGLLAHEVLHVALGHIWPWRRQWREQKLFNAAADYKINQMLKEEGFTLPEGGLLNEDFDELCEEEIYEKLEKDEKNGKNKKGTRPTWEDLLPGLAGGGEGDQQKDGKNNSKQGGYPGKPSPKEIEDLAQEWKEIIIEAAHVAKMKGQLPAGIERLVDDLTHPKVPWYTLLEQFVNEVIRDDYNELIHDRRYVQHGIYLPDMYSEGCTVAVAVDTSGSIGPPEIQAFVSETIGILRSRNVRKIRLFACDAAVTLDETLEAWDTLPEDFPGGGGTDFRPVFDAIEEDIERPACLVYLTDLHGDFPEDAPPYPVLWVSPTEEYDIPFGTHIHFDLSGEDIEIKQAG